MCALQLTSNHELGSLGDEGVLGVEVAGRDLALPDAVVKLQAGVEDAEGAVALGGLPRPLVLVQVDADGLPVLRPPALALLAPHLALEDHLPARVDLRVARLLKPSLEALSTWEKTRKMLSLKKCRYTPKVVTPRQFFACSPSPCFYSLKDTPTRTKTRGMEERKMSETLHEYRLPILLAANPEMDDDTSSSSDTKTEKKALRTPLLLPLGSCRRSHPLSSF